MHHAKLHLPYSRYFSNTTFAMVFFTSHFTLLRLATRCLASYWFTKQQFSEFSAPYIYNVFQISFRGGGSIAVFIKEEALFSILNRVLIILLGTIASSISLFDNSLSCAFKFFWQGNGETFSIPYGFHEIRAGVRTQGSPGSWSTLTT